MKEKIKREQYIWVALISKWHLGSWKNVYNAERCIQNAIGRSKMYKFWCEQNQFSIEQTKK